MQSRLAIVIPAYKKEFLRETLRSIAAQTCRAFTLYIGDDASPDDVYGVVREFEGKIDLVYKRFPQNLGAHDLVAHWNRCVALIGAEEWVWLFSDDDLMAPDCVEQFYARLAQSPDVDLLHFNLTIIDRQGGTLKRCAAIPEMMSVTEFFARRIHFQLNSSAVEYIFRKQTYTTEGGFQPYDLAWCSDDATWIRFGKRGIMTIPGGAVQWRYSGANISSNLNEKPVVLRKLGASVTHIQWVTRHFTEQNLLDRTSDFDKFKWVISPVVLTPSFSLKEKYNLVKKVIRDLGYENVRVQAGLYLLYWQLKKNPLLVRFTH